MPAVESPRLGSRTGAGPRAMPPPASHRRGKRPNESPNDPPDWQAATFVSLAAIMMCRAYEEGSIWPGKGIPLPSVEGAEPRKMLPPPSDKWDDIGFWMADRSQVESLEWWSTRLPNHRYQRGISCHITCVGSDTRQYNVPPRVAKGRHSYVLCLSISKVAGTDFSTSSPHRGWRR